ncbi:MAG: preprotein translocase subunit SecG [Methylotenera sp.]|uniref:preprotein translocase subunit SecG n=1 Tax=Methylotenera sp. TaxID=2051956 RepID=UPI002488C58F|nr:preprotein translocase subunit SecG [Methylotenera sp.]MDI1308416.1 preprotein translocase subunit SecG [Methylotenera sp.]
MEKLVLVIHVIAALGVIALVLLQHGKGADMGASFGSGASGSLFGVSGSANFMSRATAVFVLIFFTTSLTLAYMSSHKEGSGSVVKTMAEKNALGKTTPASGADTVAPPAAPTQDIPK